MPHAPTRIASRTAIATLAALLPALPVAALTSTDQPSEAPVTAVAAVNSWPDPVVDYQFEGTLTDSAAGSTLTEATACPGASAADECNASSSFGVADGDGYWTWTSTSTQGGGFSVRTDAELGPAYTVALKFSLDSVSSWRKIIDYEERISDNGFYFSDGAITFYPAPDTSTETFAPGDLMDLVAVRDAGGQFTVYGVGTDRSVTQLFTYDDSVTEYALPATAGPGSLLGFFFDDTDTTGEAAASGRVYRLQAWNTDLDPAEIGDVVEAPPTNPPEPEPEPEPDPDPEPEPESVADGACPARVGWQAPSDQVTRLYTAALGRTPDAGGLEFWAEARLQGMPIETMARHMLASPEAQLTTTGLDDAGFVDLVYRRVLERDPDASGRDFWIAQLASGLERAALVIAFSDSPENATRTGTLAATSDSRSLACRLYRTVLHRGGDDAGLDFWIAMLDAGTAPEQVVAAMLDATLEAQTVRDLSPEAFVDHLYQGSFGRSADAGGSAYWTALYTDLGPAPVALRLANALE